MQISRGCGSLSIREFQYGNMLFFAIFSCARTIRPRQSVFYCLPSKLENRTAFTARRRSHVTTFFLNGKQVQVEDHPSTPLLWVLRDSLGITGTKYGCGMALCGACTVHLDGKAIRSCVAPVSRVEGKHVTTIEGLSDNLSHPLQKAWIELDVPQCGYCQSGQIMSAAVLLNENPEPTDKDIDEAMSGNICRCGTYPRIRKAIHRAAKMSGERRTK
jgi:isoquinoline 1-oxidoreductase alpha subunit